MVIEHIPRVLKILKKIKDFFSRPESDSKVIKPKDEELAKSLEDASFRQTNVLSRTNNIFIISDRTTGEKLLADIDTIPSDIIESLREQFTKEKVKEDVPEIRLIKNEFHPSMEDYSNYLKDFKEKKQLLNKIIPHLSPEYRSILKLSSYVEDLIINAEHEKAQRVKNDIQRTYGRSGRNLCNLYLQSYVMGMISTYLGEFIEKLDRNRIREYLDNLIGEVIKNSDYIFFINPTHDVNEIVSKVFSGINLNKEFIALHSAGTNNVRKAEEILSLLDLEKIKKSNYKLKQVYPPITTSRCPTFNIFITKEK